MLRLTFGLNDYQQIEECLKNYEFEQVIEGITKKMPIDSLKSCRSL